MWNQALLAMATPGDGPSFTRLWPVAAVLISIFNL
jgi:hypothetical protein